MAQATTLWTIGTALRRAEELEARVDLLISGHWISGTIVAVDGHGTLIRSDTQDHSVIRLDHISAVRIIQNALDVPLAEAMFEDADRPDVPTQQPSPAAERPTAQPGAPVTNGAPVQRPHTARPMPPVSSIKGAIRY